MDLVACWWLCGLTLWLFVCVYGVLFGCLLVGLLFFSLVWDFVVGLLCLFLLSWLIWFDYTVSWFVGLIDFFVCLIARVCFVIITFWLVCPGFCFALVFVLGFVGLITTA